jgi:diguanylate cyclase (GGDEF)-like protein
LPLVVTVGFSVQEIFAEWWRKVVVTGISLAIICAFVLALMQQLRAELSRRTKAEAALSALATTDSLTGLANRRKFDQTLDVEWRRAERDASQMSLIMVDVDFFKAFNDAYGHQEGDRVLRAVARQVAVSVNRPADISARYGGEEFVALLPHTDAAGGERVAERIREAVAELQIVHARSAHAVVTVSLGVATMKPRYADHPSALVKAADAALYESKAAGRNRCHVAVPPLPATDEPAAPGPFARQA